VIQATVQVVKANLKLYLEENVFALIQLLEMNVINVWEKIEICILIAQFVIIGIQWTPMDLVNVILQILHKSKYLIHKFMNMT
jgi:hypothetical protein